MQQLQEGPASASTPLPGATVYRPGGALAFLLVFVPIAGACIATAVFAAMRRAIPVWLPGALLLWVPMMPFFWLALKTVRTSSFGIAAGRPWQVWREIPWDSVARVERRGARLRVTSRDYARISFTPGLLFDGGQLRRYLVTQLSPELLDDALRDEARGIAMADSGPSYPGPLPSILRARPHPLLRLIAALATLGALGAVLIAAFDLLPVMVRLPLAAVGLVVAPIALIGFAWLSQQVTLSEAGISVIAIPSGRARGMLWSQVVLLEHTRRWRAIRLTGQRQERSVPCPGPGVMRPLDAAIYRMYLKRQLRDRPLMEAQRFWLF